MKKRILQLIFIFSLISIKGYSCDCKVLSIQEAWERAELIIRGRVIKIYSLPLEKTKEGNKGELYFHELVIQEVFSGDIEEGDTVLIAGVPGGSCDFIFSNQKEYLAFIPPVGWFYKTSFCDRTAEFKSFDKQDIEFLRELGNKKDLPLDKQEALNSNFNPIFDYVEKEKYDAVTAKFWGSIVGNVLLGICLIVLVIKRIYR